MMLCNDVKNVILEYAADRTFSDLRNVFSQEIQEIVWEMVVSMGESHPDIDLYNYIDFEDVDPDGITEQAFISCQESIANDIYSTFSVLQSELNAWSTEEKCQFKNMIARAIPNELRAHHLNRLCDQLKQQDNIFNL